MFHLLRRLSTCGKKWPGKHKYLKFLKNQFSPSKNLYKRNNSFTQIIATQKNNLKKFYDL